MLYLLLHRFDMGPCIKTTILLPLISYGQRTNPILAWPGTGKSKLSNLVSILLNGRAKSGEQLNVEEVEAAIAMMRVLCHMLERFSSA